MIYLFFFLYQNLFSLCPTMLWGDEVISSAETNEKGWVTLQGFLAQWTWVYINCVPIILNCYSWFLKAILFKFGLIWDLKIVWLLSVFICRLTTFLDYTRTFAYLAYFGYVHGETETHLSTAITGYFYMK